MYYRFHLHPYFSRKVVNRIVYGVVISWSKCWPTIAACVVYAALFSDWIAGIFMIGMGNGKIGAAYLGLGLLGSTVIFVGGMTSLTMRPTR